MTVELKALDSLTIVNVVDNELDSLSTPCTCCAAETKNGISFVPEMTKSIQSNVGILDFDRGCHAAHGLCLYLVAEVEGKKRTLMFDAGPDAEVFTHNAARLGLDLSQVERVVLSHYHIDHTGGLRAAIPLIAASQADSGRRVKVDMHTDYPFGRGFRVSSGDIARLKPENPSPEEVKSLGGEAELSGEGHTVLGGMFYVSGRIPRNTSYETGLVGHESMNASGEWTPDPEINDERYLCCNVKGHGLVVFSACSHAGIINACKDAVDKTGKQLYCTVGGFHLAGRGMEDRIPATVRDLKALNPSLVLAGHCTGWRAKAELASALDGKFQTLCVGNTYTLASVHNA